MAKGREMVTSYIIGFFMNGIYQLVVLMAWGRSSRSAASRWCFRGYGIRNTVNLIGIRKSLDNLLMIRISAS